MIKVKKWMLSDGEYGDLNPPLENVRVIGKEIWYQWIDDTKWLAVGYIPTPASVIGWFFYHLIHGIWMKYPLWAIILYCLDKDNYPSREAVEQSRAADGAKRSLCKHNFDYGLYCSKCGEAQF